LSTDGGQTFPTVLAASTANDGTETLVIPNTATTTARIKIEAVGNIFFDISNSNFTITSGGATLTTITTSAVSPVTYCAGAAVSVPFTTNAAANAGNVFTAQLSNAAGSFASPVNIGTLTSTAAGTISGTIPAGTTAGSGYRIRVVSSNPVVIGSDNGANITVNVAPTASTITAGGATTFCAGGNVVLSGNVGGTWNTGATTSSITVTNAGNYFVTNSNSCGSVQSNIISVTVNPQPVASTITAGGATTFCAGGSVVLSGNFGGTWSTGATTSSITVTASGTYFVTNTNSCGSVQSNSITVTVNPQPVASTITAGGATTFCAGGSVVLSGNAGGTWSTGATTSSITVTASGTYFVTNTNSCGSVQSNSIIVTVNPQPVASTITAGGATTFCAGGSVVLSGNAGGTWSTGATTSSITVTTSGTYFVTNTNSCGSVQSNSITVTVNPQPVASTITAGGATTFCAGGSVVLSGNAGGTWSTGATTSSITVTASGTYFVTNTNSCGSVQSNSITVSVIALPTVSFTGLASSYPVNGAAVTLTGSPAGGTFSGTGISGNTFNPPTAGVGGPYTITYTYTNGSGCTNFSTQQTTVTAACTTPARPGTITTVGGTAKVCPGDVKSYSIVAVAGATSYTWSAPPGGTITAGQGTNLVTITYTSGFTVGDSLRVTANNTCGSSQARALKINRNSNASTPSAITGTIYGVCNQSGIAYSVTNVAGVTYAWSWNVANATIVSGQGTNAITASFGPTFVTGKLSVTATNACGTSSARTISVYARPAVPGAITGATSVCSMEQGVAYSIAPVPNATSYIWYAPSGSKITDGVTTSTSSSFATTATSVFVNFGSTAGQVRVKGVNSCAQGGVVATTVTFAVCKNTPFASTEVNNPSALVFPNPSNGNFSIRIANEKTTTAITEVTVLNEFGQQVYKGRVNIVNGNISLNLEDKLINGIYMVQYTVSGKTIVKKVMISK
jgi:predicted secreted protein